MAAAPQISGKPGVFLNEQGSYELAPGHRFPGWTVDALLAEGKTEEAREELERLVVEGIESGDPVEATPAFWDNLRAIARGDRNAPR